MVCYLQVRGWLGETYPKGGAISPGCPLLKSHQDDMNIYVFFFGDFLGDPNLKLKNCLWRGVKCTPQHIHSGTV